MPISSSSQCSGSAMCTQTLTHIRTRMIPDSRYHTQYVHKKNANKRSRNLPHLMLIFLKKPLPIDQVRVNPCHFRNWQSNYLPRQETLIAFLCSLIKVIIDTPVLLKTMVDLYLCKKNCDCHN